MKVSDQRDDDRNDTDSKDDAIEMSATPPATAAGVFGDRLELAQAYHRILATDGIDHGLIGPREIPRLWDRHILNCAVIEEQIGQGEAVVDIGSGAGLPGIPLAIVRPDLEVVLLEPLLRRSTFLERAVDELGLPVRVVRGRAEERVVRDELGGRDVATSRAVAPLERLSKWSAPLIRPGGRLVAIKGASAADEIERDAAAVGRAGIGGLHVELCGEAILPSPTTVVVGVRSERGGRERGRGRKR
ncbi:16S rRNA (guanine(527)-N(7))-methyltransferase RsmG [Gordonia sp. NPDC003422]